MATKSNAYTYNAVEAKNRMGDFQSLFQYQSNNIMSIGLIRELKDTNLDQFFDEFKRIVRSVSIDDATVYEFIKGIPHFAYAYRVLSCSLTGIFICCIVSDKYPNLALQMSGSIIDGDIGIDGEEFMFVYSLLLHYSCVRHADPGIQRICQTFPHQHQTAMTIFFTNLLEENRFTRVGFRHAIDNAGIFVF